MSIKGNEHLWYDNNWEINNWSFSDWLEAKFNEKSFKDFQEQMDSIRKEVDPRFLASFEKYEEEVSRILSENMSVISSEIVQEELSRQNNRVEMRLKLDWEKINDAY